MKKTISAVLAVIMILALGITAFAENGISGNSTIKVTYTTAKSYEVTIPSAQSFSTGNLSKTGSVTATNVLLESGDVLNVTMKSANNFKLVCDGSEIEYAVKIDGEAVANDAAVLSVNAGTTSGEAVLTFETTADNIAAATKAGDHIDTITFTCSVSSASVN